MVCVTETTIKLIVCSFWSLSLHTVIDIPGSSPGAPELGVRPPTHISSGQSLSIATASAPANSAPHPSGTTESSSRASRSIPGNQLTAVSRPVSAVSTKLVGALTLADSKVATVSIRVRSPTSWETVAAPRDVASPCASVISAREIGGGGGGWAGPPPRRGGGGGGGGLAGSSRHRGNASVEGRRKHSGGQEGDSASAIHAGKLLLAKELSRARARECSPRHGGLAKQGEQFATEWQMRIGQPIPRSHWSWTTNDTARAKLAAPLPRLRNPGHHRPPSPIHRDPPVPLPAGLLHAAGLAKLGGTRLVRTRQRPHAISAGP